VSEPIFKATLVGSLILFPFVSPEAVEPVVLVFTFIAVSILKPLLPLAMLERIDKHAIVGELISPQGGFSVHYAEFPLSIVSKPSLVEVEAFLMSKSVHKLSLEGPLFVDYLNSLSSFDVITEISAIKTMA